MTEESAEPEPRTDGAPETEGVAGPSATRVRRAERRRRLRLRRWLGRAFWSVLGLFLAVAIVLSQTRVGQRLVLDRVLERVRASLAGELVVGDMRSRTLLAGVTFSEVRLDAEGGRPFLQADSVAVRYSPLSLILGSPRLSSTTFHGLDLEISRYPGDSYLNVSRILAAAPRPDSASPGRPQTLGLGRVSIRGGSVRILTPAEGRAERRTVEAPGGGRLRILAIDLKNLDLENTVVSPGSAVAVDARLASLAAAIHLLEEPLLIREAFGHVVFGARGLEIAEAEIRLPASLTSGNVRFGPERPGDPWTFAAELRSEGWGDLSDLRWIDSRVPAGRFRGGATIRADEGLDLRLSGWEAELEASSVVANGGVRFGDVLSVRNLRLAVNPLLVSRLEPWTGRPLPFDGFLGGQVTLNGTFASLDATGRLTFVPSGMGGGATTADFSGTLHMGDDPGVSGLQARLDPLNYRVLEAWWPDAAALGQGSARVAVNGRASGGIRVAADVSLAPDEVLASRWIGRGVFRRQPDGPWTSDVSGDFAPLSLALLDRIWPQLELHGSASGTVRVVGSPNDLRVSGDLASGEGRLAFDGSMGLESLGSTYRLEAESDALVLSDLTDRLPDPSIVSGSVRLEGQGTRVDSLAGEATVVMGASRIGGARIDSASAVLRAAEGVLTADTLFADGSGAHLAGAGSLGMTDGAYGEGRIDFTVASLLGLRPIFMGDSILVRDGLSTLEEELLRVRGIEPDTLPSETDVRMEGYAAGSADFRGRFEDLDLDLDFEMVDAAYGSEELDSAVVSLSASGLPDTFGDWDVEASARGLVWRGRRFEQVVFDGSMSQRRGEGALDVRRRRNERYFLAGGFALDSIGGSVELTNASAQVDDLSWILDSPTRMRWSRTSLTVDSLQVSRVGEDPMLVTASGVLARGGDSSFRMDMEGFHIEHAMQIAQREDLDVSGHVDLSLTVLGPAERPVIDALFQVEDPRYGALQLSRFTGSLRYDDRRSDFRVEGWDQGRSVMSVSGVVPYDLALADVEERRLDEPMDVRVRADSLDAAIGLAYFATLEDVRGVLSADVHIGGTGREPEPSGTVRLAGGAWTIGALGVRHTGVNGELLIRPDRTLTAKLGTTENGTSTVAGVVTLDPPSNPALDLLVTFDRFQAVDRRDMASTISGEFALSGTYQLPFAQGALRVDEGTLFVEEFARASGVVDLSDPMLFADGFAVDTTVFVSQPLIADLRNPFLDNLRVDIDLSVPRNMWLRSRDMNVEMGGELLVRYDRGQGDLVLVGELQALRGSYVVLGRTFEVAEGTVAFIGQPGVNPNLDIQALSRVRRRDRDPLEIRATVQGTLIQPLVTLSSEEAGLAQSDLISYLVFGRPSGELGGAGGGLGSGLGTGSVTYVAGALANQVGAALAQGIGLDYLSVAQVEALGIGNAQGNPAQNFVRGAQVEAGWYLNDDVFVILVFASPLDGANEEDRGGFSLRGVRLEWALTDNVFVEGFVEDRFLRSGTGGLGASGLDGAQIVGAFVFREWGYGSQQ